MARECIQKSQIGQQFQEERKLTDQDFQVLHKPITRCPETCEVGSEFTFSARCKPFHCRRGGEVYVQGTGFHWNTTCKQNKDCHRQRLVQERYKKESVILQYLHNQSAKLEKKAVVKTFCVKLLKRLKVDEQDSQSEC